MTMKRFLLFCGPCYYAEGGWHDFKGDFDTLEAAKRKYGRYAQKLRKDKGPTWGHVFDTEAQTVHELPLGNA